MTAEYELSKDDWGAFNFYHHFHSPTARRQYLRAWFSPAILLLLVCLGVSLFASLNSSTPGSTFLALLPLFSGVPFYLLWFPWAYRRKLKKIAAGMIGEGRNRTLLGKQRVTISPEGVTKSSDFDRTTTAWSGVERVIKDNNYVFVYISALTAIIVPRRALADAVEFDEFAMKAAQYQEEAGTTLPLDAGLRQ